ncbi:DUF481 domain-containing protein [Flavobacterium agrisoli]|uniref:DUF481 domain-containing protein n=1 Tax=Flavobacterium agrisoli TaxID=2793066 RepID=A0A934UJT3_9FLAO|nr:DUF481 domain-containing protein [Flavobacterium agrisoli]MBK0369750.1 DUF481 domain-containing protein [Flavobacterium agrisoli]
MKKIALLIILVFSFANAIAQSDTLILKNKDVIVGKIKLMTNGALQIETDYSKDDFKIKWKEVIAVNSTTSHMINLSNGELLNGSIQTDSKTQKTYITNLQTQQKKEVDLFNIVYIKSVDDGFWDRLDANFDVGIKLTKAQNLQQLSINAGLGYTARTWFASASYQRMQSVQDDIDPIRRVDTDVSYIKLLKNDFFIPLSVTTLSNTEQDIDLRVLSKGGFGKYIVHSNKKYWGVAAGLSYNHEKYTIESSANESLEAFIGSDLNIYDAGDFSIQSKLTVFPSLTESKRIRTDFMLDTKYDLPLDFYIKLSFVYNHDSKPSADTSKNDYVFQTGFGWKLD